MYGLRLRPRDAPTEEQTLSQAPIQKLLPPEVMLLIFSQLPIASTARAQCSCRQWYRLGLAPDLWRTACQEAFQRCSYKRNSWLLRREYRGCWRRMYLDRPHVRHDGVYVSRNTYLKTGIIEWTVKNPVALVCYYRYYRFFPDGSFLYRTTPDAVSKVARTLLTKPRCKARADDTLQQGLWRLDGERLLAVMVYPNSHNTEVRTSLSLRSTTRGANNRLDARGVLCVDKADGSTNPILSTDEDEEVSDNELQQYLQQPGSRPHKRGMSPYVFVPWEGVQTSVLNKGVQDMDFFCPG